MHNFNKLLENRGALFRELSTTGGALTEGFYNHLAKETLTFQKMTHDWWISVYVHLKEGEKMTEDGVHQ